MVQPIYQQTALISYAEQVSDRSIQAQKWRNFMMLREFFMSTSWSWLERITATESSPAQLRNGWRETRMANQDVALAMEWVCSLSRSKRQLPFDIMIEFRVPRKQECI